MAPVPSPGAGPGPDRRRPARRWPAGRPGPPPRGAGRPAGDRRHRTSPGPSACGRGRCRVGTDRASGADQSPSAVGLPQQFGHLLERQRGGQLGGRPAPVDGTVVASWVTPVVMVASRSRPSPPAPAAVRARRSMSARSKRLPGGRGARVGLEQPPAHVGVERRHLDARGAGPPPRSAASVPCRRPYIDLINIYNAGSGAGHSGSHGNHRARPHDLTSGDVHQHRLPGRGRPA